ncbi:TspO/MBR family protein [Sphingomonas xinjiangensis]|uniref:Tryptophan-rich sensory protein n=1 Tax=Sphingomonas xinjiangensis TaxID=643568 RepID=A0A840YPY7_9SPHN|nr:TspO/MBR family protein [Sphingomonas xinjiangensis]MBB5710591.1 tryptophan-rich sensory protein [Sphingomonas xinjiangensis]
MQHSSSAPSGLRPWAALAIIGGVLGASALLGRRNAPEPGHPAIDRWYHRLDKPGFTPPDKVFGAVWPVLETGMAAGGYRLLRSAPSPERNVALALWLGTSAMIGGWTELFFRRHELASSSAAAAAMTGASAAYVATAARVDRPAALAGVPLTGWLVFATVLAEGVRRRNR